MKYLFGAFYIQQGSFRLFHLYLILTVVQYQQCISLMYILMFFEAYFLDVAGGTDVQRTYVLVNKGIVRNFIMNVFPKVIGHPYQSGAGNQNA